MKNWVWLFAIIVFILPSIAIADGFFGFSTSGYIRYGFGYTRGENEHICYGARGAHGVSRFGNECNQYIDFQLKHDLGDKDNGVYLHSELGWDFLSEEKGSFSLINRDERFLQLGGLGEERASIWAGRRTYRRKEAHLFDFKYSNLWGDGFGWEDVSLFGVKSAYAWLSRPVEEEGNFDSHITHDLRFYDIPFDLNFDEPARIELSINYADLKLKPDYLLQNIKMDGFSINTQIQQIINSIVSNKISVQIGTGAMADLDTRLSLKSDAKGNLLDPSDYRIYRLVNETLLENLDIVSVMFTQVIEKQRVRGLNDSGFLWAGFSGRAKIYHSDHLNYVIDGSVDYVDDNLRGFSSLVKKLTGAVQFSQGRGFYSRPALRIYATYAESDEELYLSRSDNLYESGLSIGIQFETWW